MYATITRQDVDKAYKNIKAIIDGMLNLNKIDFHVCPDAPSTYKAMRKAYEDSIELNGKGFFTVYGGGDHGLLGREYNIRFRALHDSMHYKHNLSFSFDDEKRLSDITKKEFMLHAYRILGLTQWETFVIGQVIDREIRGQIEYYELNKTYVNDQTKFILGELLEVC